MVKAMVKSNRKSMGFMYLAKRPCGKVSALSWDDAECKKDIAKSVASWINRGDTVERVERFEGDPQPEYVCMPGCSKCKETKS